MNRIRIVTSLFLALFSSHAIAQETRGAWRVIGPGGGGAQFNPTVSPVDPNLVLVNCDMTGTYISTDGGNSWRMFNLRGVARFIVLDPVNSNILYVATEGLYRSRDKGKTWELVYPKPDDVAKVLISGDHAEEQIQTRDGSRTVVQALAIDPADSNTLFAVIAKDQKAGLYRSRDAAKSWESLGDLPSGGKRIYIDPASPKGNRTVYVTGADSVGVLENGELRRQKGPAGVTRFLDIAAGFPGAGKKPIFYAVSGIDWRGGNTGATGLYVSIDGGNDWAAVPVDFLSNAPKGTANLELRAVGTSLNHPETAYLSYRDHTRSLAAAERSMGVAKTVDAGKTWQLVWRDTDVAAGRQHTGSLDQRAVRSGMGRESFCPRRLSGESGHLFRHRLRPHHAHAGRRQDVARRLRAPARGWRHDDDRPGCPDHQRHSLRSLRSGSLVRELRRPRFV